MTLQDLVLHNVAYVGTYPLHVMRHPPRAELPLRSHDSTSATSGCILTSFSGVHVTGGCTPSLLAGSRTVSVSEAFPHELKRLWQTNEYPEISLTKDVGCMLCEQHCPGTGPVGVPHGEAWLISSYVAETTRRRRYIQLDTSDVSFKHQLRTPSHQYTNA